MTPSGHPHCAHAGVAGVGDPASAAHRRTAPEFSRKMGESMQRMMADMHANVASGNADADFLTMMIPHHAGAVEMARLVLEHGRDPPTRQLAQDIIASQTIEIESMTRRLAALRAGAAHAKEFPAIGGTRGP